MQHETSFYSTDAIILIDDYFIENLSFLRFSDSAGNLEVKISNTLHFGGKQGYSLSGPIRIKSRKQAQEYLSNRKHEKLFDEKLHNALNSNKNRFFAKFQMGK